MVMQMFLCTVEDAAAGPADAAAEPSECGSLPEDAAIFTFVAVLTSLGFDLEIALVVARYAGFRSLQPFFPSRPFSLSLSGLQSKLGEHCAGRERERKKAFSHGEKVRMRGKFVFFVGLSSP